MKIKICSIFAKLIAPTRIIFFIILIWVVYGLIIRYYHSNSLSFEIKGQFGDSFGALNTLFSGLAFAGLIIAILLQKEELRLQRRELRLTTQELKRSAEAQEQSGRTISIQRFENTFFNLLSLQNQLVSELNERSNNLNYIREAYETLQRQFESKKIFGSDVINACQHFFVTHQVHNENYFKLLFNIVDYVHLSKLIENSDRYFYMNVLKSKLSFYELRIIFYYVLANKRTDLILIFDTYGFFGFLDRLIDSSHLIYYNNLLRETKLNNGNLS